MTLNVAVSNMFAVSRRNLMSEFLRIRPLFVVGLLVVVLSLLACANKGESAEVGTLPVTTEVTANTIVGTTKDGITLSLTVPTTAYVDEVVLIDARKTSGVSEMPQADGSPSLEIDFGDGFSANMFASGHAYRSAGTFTITLKGKNNRGMAAESVSTVITVADIPSASGLNTNDGADQNMIDMSNSRGNPAYYIAPASYRNATANASKLAAAIKRATQNNANAEQEIVLPAGAVFAGPILLPPAKGTKYVTIRSENVATLPARGNRVSPSDGTNMPTITAPSSRDMTLPALHTPTTASSIPSHHYRIQGLHIKKDDDLKFSQVLVMWGPQSELDAISELPHHFIMDRCWVDGGTQDNALTKDGLRIIGNHVSVVDSYFSDFKIVTGADATAMSVMLGQGPYAIWNNTFIAGSENFFFGGGGSIVSKGTVSSPTNSSATLSTVANLEVDQNIAFKVKGAYSVAHSTIVRSISGNNITFDPISSPPDSGSVAEWIATPSFLEFRRNYCLKPLKWFPRHPSWNGVTYQIKNLWEAKLGRYLLLDGNVFENSWIADQTYALQISPRNVTGGFSPASVLRDMQWSNNIVHNAAAGVRISASDYEPGYPSQLATDITFRNNLFWNIGNNFDGAGAGHELLGMGNPYGVRMKRIFFIHNTDDNGSPGNAGRAISSFGDNGGADDSVWFNNLHQDSGYGFFSSTSDNAAANIAKYLPPGNSSSWNKNVVMNTNGHTYPAGTLTRGGSWSSVFVDYASGDFTLKPGVPGKNAAADGSDVGVDMRKLRAATANTVSGMWVSSQVMRPRRIAN